jgi:hypothetical protein
MSTTMIWNTVVALSELQAAVERELLQHKPKQAMKGFGR